MVTLQPKRNVQWLQVNPGVSEVENQPPVGNNPSPEPEGSSVPPRPEEADETWDSKEDKIQNAENIQPGEQKYEYKSGMQKERLRRVEYAYQGPRRKQCDWFILFSLQISGSL